MTKQAIAWFDGFSENCRRHGVDPRKLLQKQAQEVKKPTAAYPTLDHDLDTTLYPRASEILKTLRLPGVGTKYQELARTMTPLQLSILEYLNAVAAQKGYRSAPVKTKPGTRFDPEHSIDAYTESGDIPPGLEFTRDGRIMTPSGRLNAEGTNWVDTVNSEFNRSKLPLSAILSALDTEMGAGQGFDGADIKLPEGWVHNDKPVRAPVSLK